MARERTAAAAPAGTHKVLTSALVLLALFLVAMAIAGIYGSDAQSLGANTAVIRITGPIMGDTGGGVFSDAGASSSEIVAQLRRARDDTSITGVILEINSPGGSAVASDEIAIAVRDVRAQGKPVVAWVREVGASGAYWIAASADHIVANRMSITGSIGVYGSYLSFEGFIDDWNVTHNRLVAGDRKDVGDPFETLGQDDRRYLQAKLDRIHTYFIEEIATNRNLSIASVRSVADGSFMLGVEAQEAGLVDELGGETEAIAWLEAETGETVTTTVFEADHGLFDSIFGASAQPVIDTALLRGPTAPVQLR